MNINYKEGLEKIYNNCLQCPKDSNILIIFDVTTEKIALDLYKIIHNKNANNNIFLQKEQKNYTHGKEPTNKTAEIMSRSNYIICLTQGSLCHTKARLESTKVGASFLSLPNYSEAVLKSEAFKADFIKLADLCDQVKSILDEAKNIQIVTQKGTDIEFLVEGRKANSAPGCIRHPGDLGSPPDIEVNIAPIERKTNGIIKVDGSIPFRNIGKLNKNVDIRVEDGACSINILKKGDYQILNELIAKDKSSSIIGELGFGFNPHAQLCGRMLEDEGTYKTFHVGVGSNSTIGGNNTANSHIDFVTKNPIVYIDGKEIDFWNLNQ